MTLVASEDVRARAPSDRLPDAAELAPALETATGTPEGTIHVTSVRQLKTNVYRVAFTKGPETQAHSVVIKSANLGLARHNQLVARRWLPLIDLSDGAARLEGSAADSRRERIWLVYEDLGFARLDTCMADAARVAAAVDLIATLHVRSADHPMLPDVRAHGGDLGEAYLIANVRDAVRSLAQLRPPRVALSGVQYRVRDRLLGRLRLLQDELPRRVQMLERDGGPEVLLHGDLWTTNAFVNEGPNGWHARLVDWDHAGVGRASYDLSTFLLRFPAEERSWILDRYRAAVGERWQLPEARDLNVHLETAELARYANRAIWPAVAWLVDGADWAFEELAMVAGWFDDWRPVL
ncbi:MAG TPA: phosphotransferase [Gemmatimonadales bacterium]|nr:phosphotransferase [Gemmatimonadales bacterium]